MPDSDPREHPFVRTLDDVIAAYTLMREEGVKTLPVDPAVWAAWGAIIEKRPYLPGCVRDLVREGEEKGARWYCAGAVTKKGHPHHPLYLKAFSLLSR